LSDPLWDCIKPDTCIRIKECNKIGTSTQMREILCTDSNVC
jgi:hypothetical protein